MATLTKASLTRPVWLDTHYNVVDNVSRFSVDEYAECWTVPPPRAEGAYIFGRTPTPRSTFDIYPGSAWEAPVARRTGVDEPTRLPANPRAWCRCGVCRGHRAGTKAITLRTHREG